MKNLDKDQTATILAALRLWQAHVTDKLAYVDICAHYPEHFEDASPLSSDAIDELCEQLNTQE